MAMDIDNLCRCCLSQGPHKKLNSTYVFLDQKENYSAMLLECFNITLSSKFESNNICECCIDTLRNSLHFKHQVLKTEQELLDKLRDNNDVEDLPKVKEELLEDDENGITYLDLKEELSDFDFKEEDDDKKLAEILCLKDVTIKRRSEKKRLEKNRGHEKSKSDRKTRNIHKTNVRLSLRTAVRPLADLEKMKKFAPYITENRKHKYNIETIIKHSNCTPFSNKTLYGYVCAYCKETCSDCEELRRHTSEHRNDELADNKRMDKSNISIKMDITDLACNMCGAKFDVISNLKKHLMKDHDIKFHLDVNDYVLEFKLTNEQILNCALCHSTFETFKMLLQHMNGHYRNFICDECDLGFINKHRLKNHKRTHDVGVFKCGFCDKVFNTRVRKMCHEKYTHKSTARYTTNCPHCTRSFTSYYQRNRHMVDDHKTEAASYKCNICDKSFILKSKLTSHIKKVHLMERNHICAECGQGFFIKQSLDEHMIKHNGERVHKCVVCHKAYARKKTLREHMRIHNNDRRFKCGVCALAFVQKCSLKSHMLSNHGVTLAEFENSRDVGN